MNTMITPARHSDYADVLSLLRTVNLPNEGVQEHFHDFFVAREMNGSLVGCIGQERHGNVALLRSLAVSPAYQGCGLGRELTLVLLSAARAQGISEVLLLTNTAAAFFQQHFGFTPVERTTYDTVVGNSPEWKLPCCTKAVCLSLALV